MSSLILLNYTSDQQIRGVREGAVGMEVDLDVQALKHGPRVEGDKLEVRKVVSDMW